MIEYLYDGSFEGFLTCIYHHYYTEKANGIYSEADYQNSLLANSRHVETEADKAERVYKAIEEKISLPALWRVYHIFLSSVPDKDQIAFKYILMGFKKGYLTNSLHSHPVVYRAQMAAKKVTNEAHRLKGLLRFSAIRAGRDRQKELLYGRIEPDHDVLELLGKHFSDRFKNEAFIIHDAYRGKGLFCNEGQWFVAPLDKDFNPLLADEEKLFRKLWRLYFQSIAIEERRNLNCQKRMMPVRYWKNLMECTLPDNMD